MMHGPINIRYTAVAMYVYFSVSESYPYFMKIGGLFSPLKSPPVADIQCHMNKFTSQFLKTKSNIILPSMIMSFQGGGGT